MSGMRKTRKGQSKASSRMLGSALTWAMRGRM